MFPKYKWFLFEDGWTDLGEIGFYASDMTVHGFCLSNEPLHAGKEGDELFKFCPHCMVKIV